LNNFYRIGIDLGGTKIEGVVLDGDGREITRQRVPTDRDRGYQHILAGVKSLHDELVADVPGQPTTFGIGTPGAISPRTGLLKSSMRRNLAPGVRSRISWTTTMPAA